MGKPTGFLEYERKTGEVQKPEERIQNFSEFHADLPAKEQKKQAARCMECGVPFCQSGMTIGGMTSGCPLQNLIPEWNDLIYMENWKQAYDRLAKTNTLPEFTGRVCPALCEAACTCNVNGLPVSTKENERSIIENAFEQGLIIPEPPSVRTGKSVAIIGSGPAGMAAAILLNRRGHKVTVYERNDRIGGLLRYGIPNMKLEKDIIDRRVKLMEAEGIQFKTNVNVGIDIKAEELNKKYDRVLLTCGASNPRDMKVAGRKAEGIYFAVDFLKAVTKSLLDSTLKDCTYPEIKGKDVVVIGGGDTGNDCVGTVIRLGAKSVVQLEMMPKAPEERAENNPWPQWPKICKTDYGQDEAIAVFGNDPRVYETTVTEFVADKKGKLAQVKTVKLKMEKDPKTGKETFVPCEGSEQILNAQIVLIAAGFLGTEQYIADSFQVKLNERTNIEAEEGKYETSVPNIFAAGDVRRGQSLVVWAIREGQEAAKAIDLSLMGYTNL